MENKSLDLNWIFLVINFKILTSIAYEVHAESRVSVSVCLSAVSKAFECGHEKIAKGAKNHKQIQRGARDHFQKVRCIISPEIK